MITSLQTGKYRIESLLGSGGFGNTYLAEHVSLGRKVAIKEFFMKDYCERDEITSSVIVPTEGTRQIVDRYKLKFLKEAQMIASLKNEHIIQIHDIFEENNTAYYVMEYIEGGSLKDKVDREGGLSESDAIGYVKQVSYALSYLHSRNILHLDVKPSNILIDAEGRAILIDFGVSKHYDSDGGQTSTTPVGLSKGFAPIEQYQQGSIKDFSPSTDVYSLGATLFYLLTGEVPPEASLIYEDGLPSCVNSFSSSVKKAIETAMSPRRKDRFQSTKDFSTLLVSGSSDKIRISIVQESQPTIEETIVVTPEAFDQKNDPVSRLENKPNGRIAIIASVTFVFIVLGVLIGRLISKNSNSDKEVPVVSVPAELLLDGVRSKTINISSKGGATASVAITKNFNERWTYSGVPDWCKVTTEAGSISLNVSANNKTTERSGKIVFGQSGSSEQLAELLIVQKGKKVEQKKVEHKEVKQEEKAASAPPPPPPVPSVPTRSSSSNSSSSSAISINDDSAALQDYTEIEEESVDEEPVPFQLVEVKPTFLGGDANTFSTWVNNRLVYPKIAKDNGVQGRVTLQFTVEKDGSVTKVKVLRGVDPYLDQEAVRVVSMSPKWQPGSQRDKPVPVTYTFPIIFQLK